MTSFNTPAPDANPFGPTVWVPEEDVVGELEDGRTIQLASKGVPIPAAEAYNKGLIDEKGKAVKQTAPARKSAGPSETKENPQKPSTGSAPSQSETDQGDEGK